MLSFTIAFAITFVCFALMIGAFWVAGHYQWRFAIGVVAFVSIVLLILAIEGAWGRHVGIATVLLAAMTGIVVVLGYILSPTLPQ